ncbi:MAG: efflux transporter outer membrane subunit [Kiritimatiellae bacterium]|jgi:multidrug efflux system outer membrane protein|nr:efflux transporter outer membrane subunit [Kiritimatiellia bacterium]
MNKSMTLMAIILLFAGGCTLMPKYTRPAAPVPGAWPGGSAPAENGGATNASVEIPWRNFYIDANLQKIIELALENNRDLRAAAMLVEKTRAAYRIQRADLLPTINATAYGTRQEVFANIASFEEKVDIEYYSVNLGFSAYELDIFGRVRSLKKSALEQYLATEHARRSLQISLAAEIAGACLNLAADRERLFLAQNTLDSQETSYELIQRRFESGDASELELRQAQTSVDAARIDIARYAGLIALDKNALNLLAGAPVPDELLPDELSAIAFLKDISAGLPSSVIQRRPDILEAESRLKSAHANIGAARAAFFPSVILTGNYGTMDDQLSGLFKSGSSVWNFTPQISVPIFDTGRNLARLDAAKADRNILLAQYEKAIQTAFREVADALARRESLLAQMEAQESLVQATAAAYRISEARYLNGIDSHLAVLDSQRSLYGAQQGLIAVRLARLANLVTLYKVLGGG